MSRHVIFAQTRYASLLHFSINSGSSVGNLTLASSLYSLEFRSEKFILLKFCVGNLRHPQTSGMLHCCVMGSPLDMGWGPSGSHSDTSELQCAWDSFGSTSRVFESPKRGGGFGSEMVSTSSTEIEAKKGVSKEGTLVNVPSQEMKPWRRGRPRKDTAKREEICLSTKLSACPVVEEFMELPYLSERVEIIDRGDESRKGRGEALAPRIESLVQQSEQAKIAIAKLYQENRE